MTRCVTERMVDALSEFHKKWKDQRRPKAFYLGPEDWHQFVATNPPKRRFPFGNNPTVWRDEPIFSGSPVRPSKSLHSRLYDDTATGRKLPS